MIHYCFIWGRTILHWTYPAIKLNHEEHILDHTRSYEYLPTPPGCPFLFSQIISLWCHAGFWLSTTGREKVFNWFELLVTEYNLFWKVSWLYGIVNVQIKFVQFYWADWNKQLMTSQSSGTLFKMDISCTAVWPVCVLRTDKNLVTASTTHPSDSTPLNSCQNCIISGSPTSVIATKAWLWKKLEELILAPFNGCFEMFSVALSSRGERH